MIAELREINSCNNAANIIMMLCKRYISIFFVTGDGLRVIWCWKFLLLHLKHD